MKLLGSSSTSRPRWTESSISPMRLTPSGGPMCGRTSRKLILTRQADPVLREVSKWLARSTGGSTTSARRCRPRL